MGNYEIWRKQIMNEKVTNNLLINSLFLQKT